jgi:hypothetical protein
MGLFDDGTQLLDTNDWQEVQRSRGIKKWIDEHMKAKSCVVVLVGAETSTRPWVLYEIERAWNKGKAIFGVRINRLVSILNQYPDQDPPGKNPLELFNLQGQGRETLADRVKLHRKVSTPATPANSYYACDRNMTSVQGTWENTARDHHNVYSGSLEVEVGDPLDLTHSFRQSLGRDGMGW